MIYTINTTTKFEKDLVLSKRRNKDLGKLKAIIDKLARGEVLEPKHRDHPLGGNYAGYRECHVEPDWLLVYKIVKDELLLVLMRTGTHSDLGF